MELAPGYKQTEAGLIPNDWETSPLGELTMMMTNGFVGTATRHYSNNGNGVLYIQGYNVEENSFNLHGVKFVTEDFHRSHMKSCLRSGDLLTVQTGEVGLTTVVPQHFAGANCHALIISRFDLERVSSTFISYYLNSKPGRSRLRSIETGSTMKHLNIGDMLHFTVPLPPTKVEQEAIAEALSDADLLIESLEILIAKKRALKQGAMQELLSGRRRLPGFKGSWQNKTIGEMCEVVNGLTYSPSDVRGSGTLVLRSSNIQDDVLSFADNVFVQMDVSPKTLVQKDDILICVRNGSRELIGKCAKIDERCKGMALGAFMAALRTPLHNFILQQFRSDAMKRQITEHLGATINQITNKSLKSFLVSVPPSDGEAMAVADVLSDMDDELAALDAKLSKARQIKQGMMQELLTGRVRLL